ncbi:MAG: DUF131 domain-containing protein [Thermoplasmata archaeon]|nr:DUF131 domain-containing protein [Thermoplasmata archaeon]
MNSRLHKTFILAYLVILGLPLLLFVLLALLPGSKVGFIFVFPVVFVSGGGTSFILVLLIIIIVISYITFLFIFTIREFTPSPHGVVYSRGTLPDTPMQEEGYLEKREGGFGGVIFIGPFPILFGGAKREGLPWISVIGVLIALYLLLVTFILLARGV